MDVWGPYGDDLSPLKQGGRLRIGVQNFGGWSIKKDDPTDDSFGRWISDMKFDVFGIPENNLYWPWVQEDQKFQPRIMNLIHEREVRTSWAYNSHYQPEKIKQWGGTSQLCTGAAALRTGGRGKDPHNLGRWVWQKIRGTNGKTLKIFTAYRSCDKRNSSGTQNSFHQQRHYFLSQGQNREPCSAMLEDLETEIKNAHQQGELVILLIDCNESTTSRAIKRFLERSELQDIMQIRHGQNMPPTRKGGSSTIDGIFASWAITPEACGMVGIDEGVEGPRADHRCLWMEIDMDSVLGQKLQKPLPRIRCRCKAEDPRVVHNYNEKFIEFMEEHNLETRLYQLERNAVFPLPWEWQKEAEIVDALIVQGHNYADKRCRRLITGGTAYTPEFTRILSSMMFYKLMVEKVRDPTKRLSDRTLCKYLKRAKIDTNLSTFKQMPAQELQQLRKQAYQTMKEYKRNDIHRRESWLTELARARASEENPGISLMDLEHKNTKGAKRKKNQQSATAKELRILKQRESIRRHFRKIKAATKDPWTGGLSRIKEPVTIGDEVQWVERVKKEDIEKACMIENESRFTQAAATPFNKGVVGAQMGEWGVSKYAEQVLEGKYQIPHNTDEYTSILIPYLKRVPRAELPRPGITTEEYRRGWKKMKEYTGAAPTGILFSQCKASASNARVADVMASHASVPWKSGYSYQRWKVGVDVELQKKKDSWCTKDLRTIVLLDSQFNFGNKVMSRRIASASEATNSFAVEQYGSRKEHRAIEHALNKKLTFDLARINKSPMAICSNDLKSCYDRINHSFASLCLQRVGMTPQEAECMFKTLQEMQHFIRTGYGDSAIGFGGTQWSNQCSSIYQGNGAGPIIWAAVSSPLLEALRDQGFGAFLKTSISNQEIRIGGYMFVDDMDLVQTGRRREQQGAEVAQLMQESLTTWEGLVQVSGGALNISKCAWWLIDFKWLEDGSWRYCSGDDIEATLEARNFDNRISTVARKEVSEAIETLGVHLAPSGTEEANIQSLEHKALQWADRIRTSGLRHHEAATALQATILKTLEYPLAVLEMTEENSRRILKPVIHSGLSKAGTVRYMNRAVLFGPASHLGMGMHDLHTTSVIEHITTLIRHGPRETLTGKLIRAAIEAIKAEVGWPGQLFTIPEEIIQTLASASWIKTVYMEMKKYGIQLTENTPSIEPVRHNDKTIMEAMWNNGYKGKKLQLLNRCRIRLQVTMMTEIMTGTGNQILPGILSGEKMGPRTLALVYPRQGDPGIRVWELWSKALKKVLGITHENQRTTLHLGAWRTLPDNWPCWQNCTTKEIYIREDGKWQGLQPTRGLRGTNMNFPTTQEYDTVPQNSRPAVGWRNNQGEFRFFGAANYQPRADTEINTLQEGIQTLPPQQRWTIDHLDATENWEHIATAIMYDEAFAVTDGSFKEKWGTSAFTLRVLGSQEQGITGVNRVYGQENIQCAYRSELAGIAGILTLIKLVCKLRNIQSGSITIACDNQAAGREALGKENSDPQADHFDVIYLIHQLRQELPVKVNYRYVPAHQLSKHPGKQLDIWETWNEKMDQRAKEYWTNTRGIQNPETNNMKIAWTVSTTDGVIAKQCKQSLRQFIAQRRLEDWWIKNGKFTAEQIQNMELQATENALHELPPHRMRWVVKLAPGQLPTGTQMHRRGLWQHDRCPICQTEQEDTNHLFRCQDLRAMQAKQQAIRKAEAQIRRIGTSQDIRKAWERLSRSYLMGETEGQDNTNVRVERICQQQQLIGENQWMRGRWSKAWAREQGQIWQEHQIERAPTSWAAQMIGIHWDLAWAIWDTRNECKRQLEKQEEGNNMVTIDQQIQAEWVQGPEQLMAVDRRLFASSLEDVLGRSHTQRKEWLEAIKRARASWQQV